MPHGNSPFHVIFFCFYLILLRNSSRTDVRAMREYFIFLHPSSLRQEDRDILIFYGLAQHIFDFEKRKAELLETSH